MEDKEFEIKKTKKQIEFYEEKLRLAERTLSKAKEDVEWLEKAIIKKQDEMLKLQEEGE